MKASLVPIGKVISSLRNLEDCPRQEFEDAPQASISIEPQFSECCKDIQEGDEIIIFTWLDKADRTVTTTQPRNNPKAKLTGVFSTRSPDRPNPIGMHQTTVLKYANGIMQVSELEALDGTPVVDIKPVISR